MLIMKDKSGMKKSEAMLRDSEKKYREIFENINDAIFVADQKTRKLIDCNKLAEKMIGRSKKEILTMRADKLHPCEVAKEAMKDFKILHRNIHKLIESEVITKGGVRIPVEIKSTLIRRGDKLILMGVFRDISLRIDAHNKQLQSEERYRALAEMAEDPIYILDCDGIISYVNIFGAAYFNKKPADLIGKSLPKLFGPKVAKRFIGNIRKVYKTRKSVFAFGEYEFHGSKFWLDTRLSPISDSKGNVINVMGVSRDVTSHRRAEEVLERDKRDLEKMVSENSRKLLDTQKRLDRADRLAEMDTLSASVAHELRSPLAAIGIAAYNIKTKSKDPQLDKNIRNIEIKVMESDQIIKNLLIFSGIKTPMRESVKIHELLSDSIDLVQSIFPEYDVSIRRKFNCPQNLALQADPVQLHEVFNNILNNSFESFIDKEGEIDILVSDREGDMLKIVFKDNGPGIGKEALKNMFKPFNTTKAGGTGLGLPVCRQIIDLHKGAISISSKEGSGTAVTIHIPLKAISPAHDNVR